MTSSGKFCPHTPYKVTFAITINKVEGQTFQYVGIDLRFDCFSHGQLYIGLSRTGNSENQFILLPHGLQTKNVFILRFFENNTLKCKNYMYSYLYALIQKSKFGPIIAWAKPRRGMLVSTYYNNIIFTIQNLCNVCAVKGTLLLTQVIHNY